MRRLPRGQIAKAAQQPSVEPCAVGLGAIFNHRNAVLVSKRQYALHIGRLTSNVGHDDGPGQRVDQRRNLLSPGAVAVGYAVGNHRDQVLHRNGHHSAGVSKGANDHLAKGFQIEGFERHVDGRRPRTDRIRIASAQPSGKLGAVSTLFLAIIRGQHATFNYPLQERIDRGLLLRADVTSARKGILAHFGTASLCQLASLLCMGCAIHGKSPGSYLTTAA